MPLSIISSIESGLSISTSRIRDSILVGIDIDRTDRTLFRSFLVFIDSEDISHIFIIASSKSAHLILQVAEETF